jgi:hypothetical protein
MWVFQLFVDHLFQYIQIDIIKLIDIKAGNAGLVFTLSIEKCLSFILILLFLLIK